MVLGRWMGVKAVSWTADHNQKMFLKSGSHILGPRWSVYCPNILNLFFSNFLMAFLHSSASQPFSVCQAYAHKI